MLPARTKAWLVVEIVGAYANVRAALLGSALPDAVDALRRPPRIISGRPLRDVDRDGVRLGAAVVRTLEALPADSRCLMRSLVMVRLLAARGVHGSLVIAVRPDEELALAAHAWVEVAGRPLLAPASDDHLRLVTL